MTEVEQPPLLGGRYQVGELIGTGGMADVRRGRDIRLGREVAVKVLRPDLARDPSFQARFRREAQAAASLNVPSIVSVYDTGEDPSGIPYIVMEHVEGRTLRHVLQEEGRLLPQRALELTAEICGALEVAHSAGIVHRDVKPANVMLTRTGEVKVMDFGIARAAADTSGMTQTAAVIGTAAYLSPEQARGAHVDARSDLYSTGCLLYELVTGAPPFTGDTPVAVAYQHVREDPVPPSAYDPTLPAAVDAVVLTAMAKNPANRYQSAQEMREDLLRARAGEPVGAPAVLEVVDTPPATGSPVLVDPRRRRTARGLLAAAFGVLLVAVSVGTAVLVRSALATSAELVPAPAVVGLDQADAVSALAQEGLRVGTLRGRFDEAPFGTVLAQTPEQGIVVPPRGTVDLLVSRGVEMTQVPVEAVGRPLAEAQAVLADRKLTVSSETVGRDGFFAPGTVLGVTPEPGRQVRAGTAVVLTVASGQVPVPDVQGQARDSAVAALQEAGFSVRVELQYAEGRPDVVVDQSPVGRRREAGSTVTLTVTQSIPTPEPARGPPPDAGGPPPDPVPPGE
ncbi:MAG: Serine/threonine-protein kinase PknB [uncultured Frankineae bacterium]|uniref:non-specific serine/threonine protein kinase n=1 Tax=uncultured Frankineae bacterium TaxID=437475 RepID=A0A6J4LAJ0_9ACTN|nr:MAG: Serine/threonine-protein kinase PknB [uncultured Frankineae bacterium]